jgi:hypothetical protein
MRNNYVILYTGGSMAASESEQKAVLKAWDDWYSRVGNDLVDAGKPFNNQATSITSDGMVSHDFSDCAPSGYSIIQADSFNDAVALARTCPVLKDGAKVSVYETFDPMSM